MADKSNMLRATRLETERLVLKPISPFQFARQTFHWTADKQALSDMNMPTSGITLFKWWKQMRKLNRKQRITHGIWLKGQDAPIGLQTAFLSGHAGEAVISILIGDSAWRGKGIGAEARSIAISDLFGRCGIHRVTSWINARNYASLHLAIQIGFKQEALMREQVLLLDGSRTDFLGFGLLRSEWNLVGGKPAKKDDS